MTRPPRTKRADTAARTRQRLLDAAVDQFAESGYAGTSVYAVAEAAGVTIGALYGQFGGKRGIYLHALRSAVGRTETDIDTAHAGDISPGEAAAAMVADGARFINSSDGAPSRLLLWAVLEAQRDPEVREIVAGVLAEQRTTQRRLASAIGAPAPDDAAVLLGSAAIGYAVQRLVAPRAFSKAQGRRGLDRLVSTLAAD